MFKNSKTEITKNVINSGHSEQKMIENEILQIRKNENEKNLNRSLSVASTVFSGNKNDINLKMTLKKKTDKQKVC